MKTIAEQMKTPTGGFDLLRLVLALSVILHHSFALGNGHIYLVENPPWYRVIAGMAVPMFFGLSGFLVAQSAERHPPFVYFAFRALRILPALLVVITIGALVVGPFVSNLPIGEYYSNPQPWAHYAILIGVRADFLPGFHGHHEAHFNGALWTIPWEMFCYYVLGVAVAAGALRRRWIAVLIGIASFWYIPFWLSLGHPLGEMKAPHMLCCFAMGSLLYAFRDAIKLNLAVALTALFVAIALLWLGLGSLTAIPMAIAAVGLGLQPMKPLRNDLSYGVYISAFPFQNIISATSWGAVWWINAPIAAVFALAYASLSWRLVEAPALRLKKRVAKLHFGRRGSRQVEAAASHSA